MPLPTPRGKQTNVVYLKTKGHQVVLGTAGTGKTVMAMLRALHLASPSTPDNGRVLLVTYNNALVTYLRHLQPPGSNNVTLETYGKFARGYLHSLSLMPAWGGIAKPGQRRGLIETALSKIAPEYALPKLFSRDIGFFSDELQWLAAMGIPSLEEYKATERHGRKRPLSAAQRRAVWDLFQTYVQLRRDAGIPYDWNDIASVVRLQLETDHRSPRYRHVVIDEGQDLSPEAIRSLVEVVDPQGSVTLFGDYAQQIYGQDLSWRSCGLKVRRVEVFEDNYRNSAEIARLAIAMSKMTHFGGDPDDLVEPREPAAAGPRPTLLTCANEAEEVAAVARFARDLGRGGTVAILARTWADARRACRGLEARKLHPDMTHWDATPGIFCGAYHSAKGLEFDAVVMPFCNQESLPHPDVIESFGMEEALARESKLLYVGVTRARTDLVVTHSGPLTAMLPNADSLWARVKA